MEVGENQLFTYTFRCVIHHLKSKLNLAKTKGKQDQVNALLAAAEEINLSKCHGHKKASEFVVGCLESILRFEANNDDVHAWSIGSCNDSVHDKVHEALPMCLSSQLIQRGSGGLEDLLPIRRLCNE
uniref:uncharacterized protein LOC122606312 n=1 Tax=Erigeron canadensis TaxID=72917 RepID=UPI001CB9AB4A|nr:uncharacterized protein LOC122606312 [Erigeron canadensis]